MKETPLQVLCVIGSTARNSATHTVVGQIARRLRGLGSAVDVFDPAEEPLPLFNPESAYLTHQFLDLRTRVERADAYVFGTPDYHGSISSTLKNFLDHFWQEFTGKLFAHVVCSNEKGLTVLDQLRTVARQCYAWTLPYGLSYTAPSEVKNGEIVLEALNERIDMLVHDLHSYGVLFRRQRQTDLNGTLPSFLARHRPSDRSGEVKSSILQVTP
jgi:NAD(P)H-dependent FMN reductase